MTEATNIEVNLVELAAKLRSESAKKQLVIINNLLDLGESGLQILQEYLLEKKTSEPDIITGKIYQKLCQTDKPTINEFLQDNFQSGLVSLKSDKGIDYSDLQTCLALEQFLEADKLTVEKLCQISGGLASKRGWLYFSEVDKIPVQDLQTINNLWLIFSEGKFGYSVQRELWLGVGKNWEKLWVKIGWKKANNWTRYPHEFIWDLTDAPRGHLPLSNQLRGVRVINSLLSHPAWQS
ncbi:MAG: GUN4 N-terminal ARM-like repeat domain-containing protein [Microcoleaceae cyanobacterium]